MSVSSASVSASHYHQSVFEPKFNRDTSIFNIFLHDMQSHTWLPLLLWWWDTVMDLGLILGTGYAHPCFIKASIWAIIPLAFPNHQNFPSVGLLDSSQQHSNGSHFWFNPSVSIWQTIQTIQSYVLCRRKWLKALEMILTERPCAFLTNYMKLHDGSTWKTPELRVQKRS